MTRHVNTVGAAQPPLAASRPPVPVLVLAACALAAVAGDIITTYVVIASGRGIEGNTVVAETIGHTSLAVGMLVSGAVRAASVLTSVLLPVIVPGRVVLWASNALLGGAAAWWWGAAVHNFGFLR